MAKRLDRWYLEVIFPVRFMGTEDEEKIREIAERHGGQHLGSGTDFKDRDHSFEFKERPTAAKRALYRTLKRIGGSSNITP